jgi:hypothetical protein
MPVLGGQLWTEVQRPILTSVKVFMLVTKEGREARGGRMRKCAHPFMMHTYFCRNWKKINSFLTNFVHIEDINLFRYSCSGLLRML